MSVKIEHPKKKELRTMFDDQCSPCILSCEECDGDPGLAKEWRCPAFHSGFMVMTKK